MKNEQILYVPEIDISLDDGSGINERNFVSALLEREVNVLIPRPINPKNITNLLGSKNLYTTWYLNRRNPFSYSYFLIRKILHLRSLEKQLDLQVIVFRLGLFPIDVYYAKKILLKYIFLKHLTFMSSSQTNNYFLNLAGKIRLKFVSNKYIDGCDTPSYMTRELIQKEYGINNIFIARNGTSKVETDNREENRVKDYIYMGRLSKGRNTDKLLEAFSKSKRHIDIYGFGEMEEVVRQYAAKYDNINFFGKVPYSQLKMELPNYKYGIDLTYVDTEFGKASYSQKIAQYLSYGLNVVAIDCVDNKYIEENSCGVLVDLETDALERKLDSYSYTKVNIEKIGPYIDSEIIVNQLIEFWKQN